MRIEAHAKINLALDVVRRREDGYHDLEMVMSPIGLHDLLYIDVIPEGIEITSNHHFMPTDERNIMYKVVSLMQQRFHLTKGVKIHIYKHIPMQAGLAGGSADGAACIKAMNQLFHLHLSLEDMMALGKEVGADIPFCLNHCIAYVEGIGEKVEPIKTQISCYVLLVKPKKGVSTKVSFSKLDIHHIEHAPCQKMRNYLIQNDYQGMVSCLRNSLEAISIELVPEIQKIKEDMLSCGLDGTLMSGSGSCVFGLTQDKHVLEQAYMKMKGIYAFVRTTYLGK